VYTHPLHGGDVNGRWTEPAPLEAVGANGVALAPNGSGSWATTPSGAWHASTPAADVLSPRLVACSVEVRPDSARARVVLDNSDGALNALPNGAFPATMSGGTIELTPGYLSGSGGVAEYGAVQRFAIECIRYVVERRGRLVILEAAGGWEHAARWHAPRHGRPPPPSPATRCSRTSHSGPAWATRPVDGRPRAIGRPGRRPSRCFRESAAVALQRLLAVVGDGVRADGDQFMLTGCAEATPRTTSTDRRPTRSRASNCSTRRRR
jgi:hypothetical protein